MRTITVPAPIMKPVRKRATGKVVTPQPWLNSNLRMHRLPEADLTARWRTAAAQLAADLEQIPTPVRIIAHFWKPRNGRYDPNNLWPTVKAAVDGFVDAGLLPDDDHTHVIGPDMRHGGKGDAAIVFTFEPVTAPD